MAIKGKRKSQKRARSTTGARPRPSGAPRPVAPRAKRVPFYRTFRGQLTTIVVVLALIGAGMWFVSDRSAESDRRSARRDDLSAYTRELRGHLQEADQALREMAGAPLNNRATGQITSLVQSSERWLTSFQAVGAVATGMTSPQGLEPASRVFFQAFQSYSSAARTYQMVPDAERGLQNELLTRATEARATGHELVAAAVAILDGERAEVDMDPSGITLPAALPPVVPTPAAEDEEGSGDGGRNRGNRRDSEQGDD